jgi:mono/diheme cytochrome c family protein
MIAIPRALRLKLIAGGAVLGLGLAGLAGWMLFLPKPLDFAGGHKVSLDRYAGPSPTGVPAELSAAPLVVRGKYLTEAADCAACHTVKGGAPFAGGRPFKLPFGTIWTPNITPDPETGIGRWTDAQFLRAVHKGVGVKGERLYPAFPYASYSLMPDADVLAVKAYLFTLKPVRQETAPNTFAFPFNQRWLMAIWAAFFNPGRTFEPITERSPQWNRGAYLVEGPAHCGECHTARTLTQAMNTRRKFAGGAAEGWNAYNISPDRETGIGAWSQADLEAYLSKGHAAGRGVASGPMREAVELSFSKLTPSDISAIATYVRSVPPVRAPHLASPAGPVPALHSAIATSNFEGKRIFEGACVSCHAWSGSGALVAEAQLTGKRSVNDPTAANVALMVLRGTGPQTAGRPYMPGFAGAYSDKEVAAVANYVTERFGSKPSHVTAKDVRRLRQE